jgi:hypothetical protein
MLVSRARCGDMVGGGDGGGGFGIAAITAWT